MSSSIPSNDTFNARYLSEKEIAETFIPNDEFFELIKNNHSLLMGPRGCGKTTLLKMLTPAALNFWKGGSLANDIRNQLPFYSIYIPTDIRWKAEIEKFKNEFKSFPKYFEIVTNLLVTTNVYVSTCNTFIWLLEYEKDGITDALKSEEILCLQLIEIWEIPKPIAPTLTAIKNALLIRVADINSHVNKVKHKFQHDSDIDCPEYYYHEFYPKVVAACNSFEQIFSTQSSFKTKEFRWALCFDELEIAPNWLLMKLFSYLRSTEHKFLFKLTTAPIVSLYDEIKNEYFNIDASQGNDYKIIRLWVFDDKGANDWGKFCSKLIESRFNRHQLSITPNQIFGKDSLDKAISVELKVKEPINGYGSKLETPVKLTTLGRGKLTTWGRSKLTTLGRGKLTT